MQQLTTVYQNPKRPIRQSPTFKNVGYCSPNPLRIDAPDRAKCEYGRQSVAWHRVHARAHHKGVDEEDDYQAIVLRARANAVAFAPANARPG